MAYLGIDVSKDTLDAYLLHDGEPAAAAFPNSKGGWRSLRNWLKKRAKEPTHVCLEATGRYGEGVTAFLHANGYAVSVVNPARIKGYATSRLARNKTDRIDAALIADFCRAQHTDLPLWTPPDPAQRHLQALVRRLEDLVSMRQQEANRSQSGDLAPDLYQSILTHIAFLDEQIETLKHEIQDHVEQHPDLKRQSDLISSIKGIRWLTAAKLLAEIRNIQDFDSPQQLVAFAGLNPRQRRSGSSVHGHSRISKIGSSAIRAALYMPAVSAKHFNLLLQPFVRRLEQRGHCKMSIVVAVMRKLLHLVFGVLKSGQPFDPLYLEKRAAIA